MDLGHGGLGLREEVTAAGAVMTAEPAAEGGGDGEEDAAAGALSRKRRRAADTDGAAAGAVGGREADVGAVGGTVDVQAGGGAVGEQGGGSTLRCGFPSSTSGRPPGDAGRRRGAGEAGLDAEERGRDVQRRLDEPPVVNEEMRAAEAVGEEDGAAQGSGQGARHREADEYRLPWMEDPLWMRLGRGLGGVEQERVIGPAGSGVEQVEEAAEEERQVRTAAAASRHSLRVTGPLVWCASCAAYAMRRWGARLRGECRPRRGDATRRRLELLQQGRHPITGAHLL